MNDEIVKVDETVRIGTIQVACPGDVIQRATELAAPLAKLINDKKLYSLIKGKKYVRVEGWSTLGAMIGVLPRTVSSSEIRDSGIFEAVVELIRVNDGAVIGRGIAECGADDEVDKNNKPVWANRPRYARRSMAITRATGKAYRLGFAWIMKLAGYEGTPAEEMRPTEAIEGEYKEVKSPRELVEEVSHKYDFKKRPYDPETLRAAIEIASHKHDGKTANDKQRNLVRVLLSEYYGNENKRHEAQRYLLGNSSSKAADDAMIIAFLDWTESKKDSGDKYVMSEMARKELSGVLKAVAKEDGQRLL